MSDVRNFGSMALALTSLPSATCLASAGRKVNVPAARGVSSIGNFRETRRESEVIKLDFVVKRIRAPRSIGMDTRGTTERRALRIVGFATPRGETKRV